LVSAVNRPEEASDGPPREIRLDRARESADICRGKPRILRLE